MSYVNLIIKRTISTTIPKCGKRNFRKFPIYNKRGSKIFKQQQHEQNGKSDIPFDKRGTRDVGYNVGDRFVLVPEMVPELIVPDLKDFKLKPYVSYRTPDFVQTEFTSEDLFNVVYAPKIAEDLKNDKLNLDGSPKEPSPEEKLTSEEAKLKARQTGSDLF